MPLYHKLGTFPKKTYTIQKTKFYITNSSLAPRDFTGIPHYLLQIDQVKEILKSYSVEPKIAIGKTSNHYC
jgi:homogentisate 1,2-dioxygenase